MESKHPPSRASNISILTWLDLCKFPVSSLMKGMWKRRWERTGDGVEATPAAVLLSSKDERATGR